MKLKPRQIFGLGAIVVFGGIMVLRLTTPSEKERMEQVIASLPTVSAPKGTIEFPPLDLTPPTAPQMPDINLPTAGAAPVPAEPEADYFSPGSQAAKDDLYCAGILRAHFNPVLKADGVNAASEILELSRSLAGSGITRLRSEGLAADLEWVYFDNAHGDKAEADYAASTPRISAADCTTRGRALPADTLKLP